MYYMSINYYGYDKNRYNDCLDLICETNYRHILIINTWLLGLTIVFMILSRLNMMGVTGRNFTMYLVFMIISLALEGVLIIFRSMCIKYAQVVMHLSILLLMSFGIYSSMMQPYLTATMFLVLIVLIAVAFIGTMVNMSVLLILYSSAFLYTSFKSKSSSLAELDTNNVIIFLILALVLHYSFQRTRMEQFHTLKKNIQIQRDLEIRSSFDTLTNLLNRARFFSIAGEIVSNLTLEDEYIAVCLLDLDSFKQINDTLGHQMGDKAIQMTASIISDSLGIDLMEKWSFTSRVASGRLSFAGRLGGDEYIMFIRGLKGSDDVHVLLENILKRLNSVHIGELNGIHASIGFTSLTDKDTDIDSAYTRADNALYASKESGKNKISFG